MHLETERLLLRPISLQDTDDIYEYSKNPNVGPNAGWKPHESREETVELMKEIFLDKEDIFGIILKEKNKLIGSIGLTPDPKRVYDQVKMLGYAVAEPYWNNGYTTEAAREIIRYAFEHLHLQLISVYCYPFNERSKSVIRKCGFEYEGTLKSAEKLYNGEIYDHVCFALKNNSDHRSQIESFV
ncbi:MAG: GNAT family protein [Bacteroidales bacterium]